MAKITLNSASFKGFAFTTGPKRGEGGAMVISEWVAPWTEANCKAGGWKEIPETVSGSVNLIPNELAAVTLEFTPGKGMESHAFSLDVSGMTDIKCFIPTKEGEPRELRFNIKSSSIKAGKVLDTFGRTAGSVTGRLKITHDDSQASLMPEEDGAEEDGDG